MQVAREIAASASALLAYVTTVLPRVHRQLRQLGPLPPEKARNAEAVSVFATLAPRSNRVTALRSIVALQVAIDLRDELEESAGARGPRSTSPASPEDSRRIERLEAGWRREAAKLPAYQVVLPRLEAAIERCRQGQLRTHRAAGAGPEPLERWARGLETPGENRWWEIAAGASSSVAAHALIAAAADPGTTAATSALIDAAYHPPIGALTVFLDDLVDREADRAAGEHNYLDYYPTRDEAANRLVTLAHRAEASIALLPDGDRHRAILAGVAAYYLSDAATEALHAQPIRRQLLAALGPGARLLAGFMRLRRLGERKRPGQAGNSPGP